MAEVPAKSLLRVVVLNSCESLCLDGCVTQWPVGILSACRGSWAAAINNVTSKNAIGTRWVTDYPPWGLDSLPLQGRKRILGRGYKEKRSQLLCGYATVYWKMTVLNELPLVTYTLYNVSSFFELILLCAWLSSVYLSLCLPNLELPFSNFPLTCDQYTYAFHAQAKTIGKILD